MLNKMFDIAIVLVIIVTFGLGCWNIVSGVVDIIDGHWLGGVLTILFQLTIFVWWIRTMFLKKRESTKETM